MVRVIEGLLYPQVRRNDEDIFSILLNMKVYCVFNEAILMSTQYTISQCKNESHPKLC